ncbi:MAG: ankyrin repeat domain-containing protein [Bacteroidetes bacterium]|nr:ankyrin repeat domain-containing protein [Bacteroidota bacterium]
MQSWANWLILIFICLCNNLLLSAGGDEKAIFKAIKNGDTITLKSLMKNDAVNQYFGKKKDKTLLHQAIVANQLTVVIFLVENEADIELATKGLTPLMDAANLNRLEIAHFLLNRGASVDATDAKDNTALFYSARYASLRMTRLLVQRGADVKHKNYHNLMALDNAVASNKDAIAEYLTTMIERKDTYRNSPDYSDGPHVLWEEDGPIRVYYFNRGSSENMTLLIDHYFGKKEDEVIPFRGFSYDTTASYQIYRTLFNQKSQFENVGKILAIGDRHGYYDSLVDFLRNNAVIDDKLDWTWGSGHLLFTGDLFDRGDKVTEILWLIYKLERQARAAGGDVHVLLGNHELMNITNDLQYNSPKYQFFSTYFDINYSQLYTSNTVLGQWLRSKNIAVKINDILFIHGGISPQLFDYKLSIDTINEYISNFLQGKILKDNDNLVNFLLFTYGPFWYRGYFTDGTNPPEITVDLLDQILNFYGVNYMVIGHTDVHKITPIFNNKIFPIDIPFEFKEFRQQGLLIEKQQFFKLYSDGKRILLF